MNDKCRILLVDDERGIAEGLSILIKNMNQSWEIVGIADDGKQGIEMVHELDPDIVITDVRMPVMDGLTMVQSLSDENARCRYIILSGYADFAYAKQAMKLGVRAYVTKPVDEDELADAINTLWKDMSEDEAINEIIDDQQKTLRKHDTFDKLKDYITNNYNRDISLQELSDLFYMNPVYISQLFKKRTGMTFQNYVTILRLEKARKYLEETDLLVYEISELVGYNDTVYFSRVFEKNVGVRPSEYRRNMTGQASGK